MQILEYAVCRKLSTKMRESVMICSEFAGCNEAMRGVLRYNPFQLSGFNEQMDKAMTLTANQREQRMNQCYSDIQRQSMSKWTENFLKDMIHSYQPDLTSYYLGLSFSSVAR